MALLNFRGICYSGWVKGKICIIIMSQVAHQAGAYPGFCSMK